ncbi:hypothetical protein HT031_001181 [Scenedesmus sp. PABB004]|nr:hypothetical protein HT031_001181 [Scenedesmus sp. PABB004]
MRCACVAILAVLAGAGVAGAAKLPLLCVASLSYNRPHYLVPSVRALLRYMARIEPRQPFVRRWRCRQRAARRGQPPVPGRARFAPLPVSGADPGRASAAAPAGGRRLGPGGARAQVLQILDNGSSVGALANATAHLAPLAASAGGRLRLVHLRRTVGLSRGFNLLFSMCTDLGARYVLSLEDDWQARADTWPASLPVVGAAMAVLERDDTLLQVWLRDLEAWRARPHALGAWEASSVDVGGARVAVSLVRQTCRNLTESPWGCAGLRGCGRPPAAACAGARAAHQRRAAAPCAHSRGWSNGATLIHMPRLHRLGPMPAVDGEADYSARACRAGFSVAFVCGASAAERSACVDLATGQHAGLFEHIGAARVAQDLDARYSQTLAITAAPEGGETLADLPHDEIIPLAPGWASAGDSAGRGGGRSAARGWRRAVVGGGAGGGGAGAALMAGGLLGAAVGVTVGSVLAAHRRAGAVAPECALGGANG